VTDPREGYGLNPEELRQRHCPSCEAMEGVRTRWDADGTKHHSCVRCGHSFDPEAAGSFEPAGHPDNLAG
jgi:rubredoxin